MTLASGQPSADRRKYRPPVGIPLPQERTIGSALVSVFLHALIVLVLIGPFVAHDLLVDNEGAGGPGPAGGGGGGNRGSGGAERATYIEVAPPPPPVARQPSTQPQLVTPPVQRPPEPQPIAPPLADPIATTVTSPVSTVGTGGTGSDGSGGTGPGTGGGRGSGVGTGTGSGTGPGTGGGSGRVYPPTVTHLAMLPVPVPAKVRPYTLVAVFEVDERGNARLLHFNESKDSGYNKKIRAMLEEIRFRPAVRADGTPVRDTTSIIAEARL